MNNHKYYYGSNVYRVIRGGCWNNDAEACRSADRNYDGPEYHYDILGFRIIENKPINKEEIMLIKEEHGNDEYGKYKVIRIDEIELKFRWIEPGTFMMGSPKEEIGRFSDEHHHEVEIKDGFWMLDVTITRELWKKIMGTDPAQFKSSWQLPVESITWYEAKEFCKKFSELTGHEIDLPSEEQWEYAARAGTTTPFYTGETITTDQANFDGRYPYREEDPEGVYLGHTVDVKTYPPNPWGLYQMLGNVWEFTRTVYKSDNTKEDTKNSHGM